MAGPLISFLTDFGGESAPAVCRGVMWAIAPDARILDLNHNVRKFAIRDGAFLLSRAVPYLPRGVHVAVVDPGVGTARHAIAIRTRRGDHLVGPDNGLLLPAARVLGGVDAAHQLTETAYFLPNVSSTFHGRDVFAPVGAHLATGVAIDRLGPAVHVDDLVDLRFPEITVRDGVVDTVVLFVDSFGNCRLAGRSADLPGVDGTPEPGRSFRLRIHGMWHRIPWHPNFGSAIVGTPLLYEDADYDGLGIAVDQGSAAERFSLAIDTSVRIEPA
jgi:S-adenosyl-L-methionine hydrolase (adenosine-forming)